MMSQCNMNKAVFLDRDGVINKKAPSHQYITRWGDFQFLQGVADTLRSLQGLGYILIVVTNQRGIARGMMTVYDLEEIHMKMSKVLEGQGVMITDILYCPHDYEERCGCRKPEAGMILEAARRYNINLGHSFIIGDSISDIEAGRRAGLTTIFLRSEKSSNTNCYADYIVNDLGESVALVTK